MTLGEESLSQVPPLLVAALICDSAVEDPHTKKKNLIGIFDRINVGSFPSQRAVSLYFKVADAIGRYEIEIRYVHANTNNVLAQAKGGLTVHDRLASADLIVPFPPLPVPQAGRYEFQIWANSMFLGQTFMDAVVREMPTSPEVEQE